MMRSILTMLFPAALLLLGLSACVDHAFDEPPVGGLSSLEANATIADIKALHRLGTPATLITNPLLIEGIVTADDESGNFYRQIAMRDASGGIFLRLNANALYNDYPVGTRLVVDCQGLYIGDFNRLYQISGSPDDGIEEVLFDRRLFVIERGLTVEPTPVKISELKNSATLNRLLATPVRLDGVEFIQENTGTTYADVVNRQNTNLTLKDCHDNEIIVRTSGYADFANQRTPAGKGSLTAILTVFDNTRQLVLRNLGDVQLTGGRCGTENLLDIGALRAAFRSGAKTAPEGKKLRGTVISDKAGANILSRNLVIQDATGGIVVRFKADHDFPLGESLEIDISGQELSEYNGLLQVNEVPNERAVSLGNGPLPSPREVTIQQIANNMKGDESWESTLVRVRKVVFEGGGVYAGSKTLRDATGSVTLFTRNQAKFAEGSVPSSQVGVLAIVSQFDETQLNLRNEGDVFAE